MGIDCEVVEVFREVQRLREENAALKSDQRKWVFCPRCHQAEKFPLEHALVCPKHPMRELERKNAELTAEMRRLVEMVVDGKGDGVRVLVHNDGVHVWVYGRREPGEIWDKDGLSRYEAVSVEHVETWSCIRELHGPERDAWLAAHPLPTPAPEAKGKRRWVYEECDVDDAGSEVKFAANGMNTAMRLVPLSEAGK